MARVGSRPERPAGNHEQGAERDHERLAAPSTDHGDHVAGDPQADHRRSHLGGDIAARPACLDPLEFGRPARHDGRGNHRRDDVADQASQELVLPEQPDRDELGQDVGADLRWMNLVVQGPFGLIHGLRVVDYVRSTSHDHEIVSY